MDTMKAWLNPAEWREDAIERSGWKLKDRGGYRPFLQHVSTGLRLTYQGPPRDVECSLPRVLFGTNSKLIRTQQETEASLRRVLEILDEVVLWDDSPGIDKLLRLDFAVHIRHPNPQLFIAALGAGTNPMLRAAESERWKPGSIGWLGSRWKAKVYDKNLEVMGVRGDIVRLELQMRGRLLKRRHGVLRPDFDRAYKVLRKFFLGFQLAPIVTQQAEDKVATMLAAGLSAIPPIHWEDFLRNAFAAYEASPATIRAKLKQTRSALLRAQKIDLCALLPSGFPIDAPDHIDRKETPR